MHPPESLEQLAEEFHTIFTSMKSPKRKRISNVKAGVLIVEEIQSAIPKGTAVRFDLSKAKGIKGASVFRSDLHDHLIPITLFLDCHNLCENRCHDWRDADFPKRERTTLEKVPLTEKNK